MRTFYFLTVIMVLLMIATVGIKAQTSTIDIGNVDPAYKGQVITVPISVHNFISVGAYQFTVNFTPADLELVQEVDAGSPILGTRSIYATDMATANTNGGKLTIAWTSGSTTLTQSDGTLLELKFYVLSTATTPSNITITNAIVTTNTSGDMYLGSTPGRVTISPTLNPTIRKVANGNKLDLTCENFNSFAGFQITLTYDAVKYTGTPTITYPNTGITGVEQHLTSGQIVLAWAYGGYPKDAVTLGTNGSGVLASIDFGQAVTVSASDFPSLTASARTVEAVKKDMVAGPETITTATMKLGSVLNAVAGTVVTVPITVTNFNNVGAFQFAVTWASTLLELAETPTKTFSSSGIMTSSVGLDPNGTTGPNPWDANGTLTIAWASGTPLNFGDGTLLNLKFKVLVAAAGSVNIDFAASPIVVDQSSVNILKAGYPSGGKVVFQAPGTPTFTLGSGTVVPGGKVNIPITVANFSGFQGLTIYVNVPSGFSITAADVTSPALSAIGYFDPEAPAGYGSLAWVYSGASTALGTFADGTTIANLQFTYNGSGTTGTVPVTFSSVVPRDKDNNAVTPVTTNSGVITLSSPNLLVKAKVFLQGPFSGSAMNTTLATGGYLPLAQPYTAAPWSYAGTETVANTGVFTTNSIVDWVLVELRSTATGAAVTNGRAAALLKNDGTIVSVDGTTAGVSFTSVASGSYFIVIKHRNHLSVMSAAVVALPNGTAYDFTTAQAQAYGTNPMVALTGGVFGLYIGDVNASGIITSADINSVIPNLNLSGYYSSDVNFSGIVTSADINIIIPNLNVSSSLP